MTMDDFCNISDDDLKKMGSSKYKCSEFEDGEECMMLIDAARYDDAKDIYNLDLIELDEDGGVDEDPRRLPWRCYLRKKSITLPGGRQEPGEKLTFRIALIHSLAEAITGARTWISPADAVGAVIVVVVSKYTSGEKTYTDIVRFRSPRYSERLTHVSSTRIPQKFRDSPVVQGGADDGW